MIGVNGRPRVKDLKAILQEWLLYRTGDGASGACKHRLEQVEQRLHILEGLMTAYLNIDEVIRIVREEDEPRQELMRRFSACPTPRRTPSWTSGCGAWQSWKRSRSRGELDELQQERESPATGTGL